VDQGLSAELLQLGGNHVDTALTPLNLAKTEPEASVVKRPAKCTLEQLMIVRKLLSPTNCAATINKPYTQKCSLTTATKCPDTSNYLEKYYDELQKQYLKSSNRKNDFGSFVALSVGCNKGFDALNTLRMGTFDASLSKEEWKKEMLKDGELWVSVCAQDSTSPFSVDAAIDEPRQGVVHCFEPMPTTVVRLQESSKYLGYDKKGYKVVHAAVDNEVGKVFFPASAKSGVENLGIDTCIKQQKTSADEALRTCTVEVEVLTLNKYVKENIPGDGPIHILQIDVEGYDNNVLLGAGKEVLERVEYLEFEYNWMGPWKNQHLYDTIEMLDELDFTCYWTGRRRLWRITGCWQLYFDIHAWSNISCANRRRVPILANMMEHLFQQTLKAEFRGFRLLHVNKSKVPNQEAMSTDPEVMTSKYLSDSISGNYYRRRVDLE
jgi:FkbM family methyltransferase